MLKQLTLKNFRQHEDRTFDLTPGLNVVRGANEAGKSTLLEAIAYALFGSKACREPLAQVVTWGKPEKSLAVELVLAAEGVDYVFSRSPKGAEANYDGGRVVGQAEVSAFAQRLLGADSAAAGKLMLASQGAIRGALDEGATKTMKLIEDLADFDIIDRVVDLLQEAYVTGPTTNAEDRLVQAEAALKAAQAAATPPDTVALEGRIGTMSAVLLALQGDINKDLRPAYETARSALNAAEGALKQRQAFAVELENTRARRDQRQLERRAALDGSKGPGAKAIEAARAAVRAAEEVDKVKAIFKQFGSLDFPEAYWEGSKGSFDDAFETTTRHAADCRASVGRWSAELAALEKARQGSGTKCGACGQQLPNAAAITKHLAEIDAKCAGVKEDLETARRQLAAAEADLVDLRAVAAAAQPLLDFQTRYPDYVRAGVDTFPPRLVWIGPSVDSGVGATVLKAELAKLERAEKDAAAAAVRVEMLGKQIEEDERRMTTLEKQIADCAYAGKIDEVRAAYEAANTAYNDAAARVAELTYERSQVEGELKVLKATHAQAVRNAESAGAAVRLAKSELEQLQFNNVLLKRLRAARPLIADKLWAIVLTAVSTYFSAMRGTKSVVVRQGNEFLVDGKPIGGLSGSTLDILGLSIRLALTKTFLPAAPFLILDEPAAAMDDDRTQATLGFLVAAGFNQTLLVTHEEQSESVADNLITI